MLAAPASLHASPPLDFHVPLLVAGVVTQPRLAAAQAGGETNGFRNVHGIYRSTEKTVGVGAFNGLSEGPLMCGRIQAGECLLSFGCHWLRQ